MYHFLLHTLHTRLRALAYVLPSSCCLCGCESIDIVCCACKQQFLPCQLPRCLQCAIHLPSLKKGERCGYCLQQQPAFDFSLAACNYEAPFDHLVLALKFKHHLPLACFFADALLEQITLSGNMKLPDMLCPVPLSKQGLAKRGFNQSLEMAKVLSQRLGVPLIPDLLIRTRNTPAQSSLARPLRIKNVRNAFIINPTMMDDLVNKQIAIVDDVLTTGATLNELATLLKRFGAKQVSNFVFARTTIAL